MEEVENIVRYIKDNFDKDLLKVADFIERANVLSSTMKIEKVKQEDKIIDKKTNILETSYLRMCSEGFEGEYDILGEIFLHYQDYLLRDLRSCWRFDTTNLKKEWQSKCSYCNIDLKSCPMKVLGYIKKIINDGNLNEYEVFDKLMNSEKENYSNDEYSINYVVEKICEVAKNKLDIAGSEFLIQTESIVIEKEESGKLYYRYLDFKIKNISFINNLYDFFVKNNGLKGEFSLTEIKMQDNFSYMFDQSPIEIAVYLKYLCNQKNIDPMKVLKRLYSKIKTDEDITKVAYYNEYIQIVDRLEYSNNVKEEIKNVLTYIRNYSNNPKLPYIQFNLELFTKNIGIVNDIVNILNRYVRTYLYLSNKNLIFVDTEKLIKTTRDSNDVFFQIDKIYNENDFIVFTDIDKIKFLNEYRVDSLFTAIEKYYSRNKRTITILVGEKGGMSELIKTHELLNTVMITKKIDIEEYDIELVKTKITKNLEKIGNFDKEFKEKLDIYIEDTYNPKILDANSYIQDVCNSVIFNKFKIMENGKSLKKEELPELKEARELDEILEDLNDLVGVNEVKYRVLELIKYLEYSKKIDNNNFINLNMIFKGNAGTGKTTIARLIAELLYKLKFIKKSNSVEVTSKDLIGDHLGQTAPKTQKVIEAALDGVLFIDEAYSIMASKGTADYASECISTLCKAMELYKDRLVVIFAGYTKEMNEFINKNQGLMSRIGYEIEFPDFSKEELLQIFKNNVEENEFIIEDGVEDKIKNIIEKNKLIRNFGNARFIVNLFEKLVLTHAVTNNDDSKLKVLTAEEVDKMEETIKDKERGIDEILKDLNSLIGLKDVKETVNGFVSLIELNNKLDRKTDFNMHMIFKGNAGTGKTTVARLLAEIYYNLGYIKKNKLVEVQSQDLIGEYIGQTGPKTQNVIDSAIDGVLFIDEAYSIMEHMGTNASYTDECIATLLKAMEDYQGRLIIIFAGYTEEMKKLRDQNPGLKSRIGFELTFVDYTEEELMQIFDKKLDEKEFKITEKAREKIRKILEDAKQIENFGNGRFVENTIQKVIVEHANQTRNINDTDRLLTITEEDIKNIKAEESRKRIGF